MQVDEGLQPASVTIVNVDMPFWSIVVMMLKIALASIPAAIVLAIVGALLSGMLVGLTH